MYDDLTEIYLYSLIFYQGENAKPKMNKYLFSLLSGFHLNPTLCSLRIPCKIRTLSRLVSVIIFFFILVCGITEKGIPAICDLVRNNVNLQMLDLGFYIYHVITGVIHLQVVIPFKMQELRYYAKLLQ